MVSHRLAITEKTEIFSVPILTMRRAHATGQDRSRKRTSLALPPGLARRRGSPASEIDGHSARGGSNSAGRQAGRQKDHMQEERLGGLCQASRSSRHNPSNTHRIGGVRARGITLYSDVAVRAGALLLTASTSA
eukprot:scaffold12441_cov29-Tisochrysis_lutea.AAC.3